MEWSQHFIGEPSLMHNETKIIRRKQMLQNSRVLKKETRVQK